MHGQRGLLLLLRLSIAALMFGRFVIDRRFNLGLDLYLR